MQYKYIIGYLRLSQDDEDATDESNSIKNQRLLIQQFIQGNKEFEGAKNVFFTDAPDIIGLKQNPTKRASL